MDGKICFEPQPGPQAAFISSPAEIAIFGGAAGGGKTYGLLLDPLRHLNNPDFSATIFRRTSVQVRNQGSLWDQSKTMYPFLGARAREAALEWIMPQGMRIKFAHLEHDNDVFNYQGSQLPLICFDELTHFSEQQFFYMLSRNRSMSGAKPRVRGTCNPDPDSFVRKLIDWWIGPDGFPIPERSGRLRWFIRTSDQMIWADSKEQLYSQYGRGPEIRPKSLTFIPSKLQDNRILMDRDPGYLANLLALSRVDRGRLLEGNWNIRASAGSMFRREWFPIVDAIPSGWYQVTRAYDRAATKPTETNKDPDWTRGILLYRYANGKYLVADMRSIRDTPFHVEQLIKHTASMDGAGVRVVSQQDPGSAGVAEGEYFIRMLAGYDVHTVTLNKDKVTRAKPVSAQAEAGNVVVLRGAWNDDFFTELENFPEGSHDDIVDALSLAFNESSGGFSLLDVL